MYFYFYPISNLQCPQHDGITLPPHVLLVAYPLHAPLRHGRQYLVGCCVLVRQLALDKCHHVLYFYFLRHSIWHPKWWDGVPPQAPWPAHLLSNIQPVAVADSRLIVTSYPQTAATSGQSPAHLSIFDVSLFGAPNRKISHGAAKPDGAHLAWAYTKWRHHDLGAPLTYPWRERAKPRGVRVVVAHAGCCVFLCFSVVVVNGLLATNNTYFVESWYRIGQKWSTVVHSKQKIKIHHQTTQMLRRAQSPHGVRTLHML